jgi:hypothetical protein
MAQNLHIVRHHLQRLGARVRRDDFAAVKNVSAQLHQQVFELVAFRVLLGAQEMGHGWSLLTLSLTIAQTS